MRSPPDPKSATKARRTEIGWRRFSAFARRGLSRAGSAVRRVVLPMGLLTTACVGLLYTLPLPARLEVPPSTFVTYRDGSPAHVFLSPDDKYRMEISPEEVDPDYLDALFRFEDKRFYRHPGVDPIAIARSAALNLRHGRVLSGASTLTMQLVRLLEPRPRTLVSKAIEAVRAIQIELQMTKQEVLTAYLAFIPFGGNLEGIEAASHAYFGHSAKQLSAEEIAILLAIPQRPASRAPSPENRERLRAARDEIGLWLLAEGLDLDGAEPRATAARLRAASVPTARLPMPREAPYFAYWARAQLSARTRIETTLDRNLQRTAEEILAADAARFSPLGIDNAAITLMDYRTGELVAAVGGFDYWSDRPGSQIPAFDVPRSPGSALKPLIYGLALDAGEILPERIVADIPLSYGAYVPGNYDGRFAGLVPMEAALSQSLNIPFVRLLGTIGVDSFLTSLRRTGFSHLDPRPGHYGLSAAIGAVEVTPLELLALYGALGNAGEAIPLHWQRGVAPEGSRRILTAGASFLTNRALARRDRPDFPNRRRFRGVASNIHWKTGTSYGHRDAWAAGFADRYAAAVWLGNLDNRSSADLVGADAAGPLLFDLLEGSEANQPTRSPRGTPPDLQWVDVCAESGYLPNSACPRSRGALALKHQVPTDRCPYHRKVDIDLDTGLALTPGCRSGRRYATQSVVVWPASLRRYLTGRHRTLPQAPTLDPACRPPRESEPPVILSPPAGQILVLLPGIPSDRQELPLQAEISGPPQQLSWFLDGEYLGAAASDDTLWWSPVPGIHRIVVVDRTGQSSDRVLEVRQRI